MHLSFSSPLVAYALFLALGGKAVSLIELFFFTFTATGSLETVWIVSQAEESVIECPKQSSFDWKALVY